MGTFHTSKTAPNAFDRIAEIHMRDLLESKGKWPKFEL